MTARLMVSAVVLLLTLASARADAPSAYYDLDLVLQDALLQDKKTKDLLVHLGFRDGQWDPYLTAWAGPYWLESGAVSNSAKWFNAMDHEGSVKDAKQVEGKFVLTLAVTIHDDPWVPGGPATYTLDLKQEDQSFTGTFTGTFKGEPVKGTAAGKLRRELWPKPVPGVEPFKPGEHPRVVFRKTDLPALRERMKTPEGQAILARLRKQLGGGEAMPTEFNTATAAYGAGKSIPVGGYTLWHGMGFGFLYQLTGEQKYADLARQCVDKAVVEKIRDRDQRYSFDRPGGKLRAGSSYAAIAMAYDFCYDAWPEDYRKNLAKTIQHKIIRRDKPGTAINEDTPGEDIHEKAMKEPVNGDLVFNTLGGQHSPFSNHYGAWNGGGGHALLAILHDPGTEDDLTELAHRIFQRRAKRALEVGYGTAGFFFEGHYCGRLNTNTGLSSYLQALRVAEGKDFITPSPEANWLLTKWIYETVRYQGKLVTLQRGMYAHGEFDREGQSGGGDYAQGFSNLIDAHKPPVLWFYNHVICPQPEKDFDAMAWPHRAVYAFVNWPLGLQEKNPGETLPKYLRDTKAGYYVFRSGWSGTDDDIVATMYVTSMQQHTMAAGVRTTGAIFGMGQRGDFKGLVGREESFEDLDQGTACLIRSGGQALLADMSGISGAPLMLVEVSGMGARGKPPLGGLPRGADLGNGDGKPRIVKQTLRLGATDVTVTTVQKGIAPKAEVTSTDEGPGLKIGQRTLAIRTNQISVGRAK